MAITVRNLTKLYGTEKAVDDISFDVKTGEILGFLGPNGAGKTTTMKVITCYMPPTSGTVDVDGFTIADRPMDVRRKIGYLPENNPLYMDMNVIEYLEFTGALHGMRGQHLTQRIRGMVDICGLGNVRHKDIGELSKGFRQRVGLAQAMLHDPDVLILDEPTSGLDPNQIIEIRQLIRRLGAAKTVVLSTHILQEVTATCDRVIIINDGKLAADGTPADLQRQFQGAEQIALEFPAAEVDPMAVYFPKLKAVAGVEAVQYAGNETGGFRFVVSVAPGTDVRADLFRLAVAEQWVLTELSRKAASLEDVFHKLTRAA